jgi:hypothetical protein
VLKTYSNQFQEGLWLYGRQKMVQHHVIKEMCKISVVYPLFGPTLVCDNMLEEYGVLVCKLAAWLQL